MATHLAGRNGKKRWHIYTGGEKPIGVFTLIAASFFVPISTYYVIIGDVGPSALYIFTLLFAIGNYLAYRLWHNEIVALFGLVALGLPVHIPWQITGGIDGTGLWWYYIHLIWLLFVLGRTLGGMWIGFIFILSASIYSLQLLGVLPPPHYSFTTMVIFYFGFVIEAAILLLSQSAKERTQQQLVIETSKAKAILGSIGDGVVAIDTNKRIILFNNAAEQLTGFTTKETLGKSFEKFISFQKESNESYATNLIDVALLGEKIHNDRDTFMARKSGDIFPIAASAAPVRNEAGEIQGVVITFHDVTAKRQLDHMKDEFLSIASHELRTPMGAVRANLSMILAGDYGPVSKDLVEPLSDMKESTVRLVDLVNDFLDASRLEAGRMKFTLQQVSVGDLVKKAAAQLRPLAKENGVTLDASVKSLATVQADPAKVEQVLNNLIGNALKFTKKGSITIECRDVEDMVTVSVRDTGVGIPPEHQNTIFEKFEQVVSAKGDRPTGSGLGLYISREMVRKMGGELRLIKSTPDEGTEIAFTLPVAGTVKAAIAAKELTEEAHAHPGQQD